MGRLGRPLLGLEHPCFPLRLARLRDQHFPSGQQDPGDSSLERLSVRWRLSHLRGRLDQRRRHDRPPSRQWHPALRSGLACLRGQQDRLGLRDLPSPRQVRRSLLSRLARRRGRHGHQGRQDQHSLGPAPATARWAWCCTLRRQTSQQPQATAGFSSSFPTALTFSS
jgi:hypothetical protein